MFFKEQTHYEHWVDLDFGLASCVALRVAMLTDSHGPQRKHLRRMILLVP